MCFGAASDSAGHRTHRVAVDSPVQPRATFRFRAGGDDDANGECVWYLGRCQVDVLKK